LKKGKKAVLFVNKEDGRLCVHGLKGVMRNGKAIVELPREYRDLIPGDFVWDMSDAVWFEKNLYVVVWRKVWNDNDQRQKVFMFKFRLALADEVTVETVMRE
jgi:hypothetical protein